MQYILLFRKYKIYGNTGRCVCKFNVDGRLRDCAGWFVGGDGELCYLDGGKKKEQHSECM